MSTQRRCEIHKATDGRWYMLLGNFEYAEATEDCTWYGPFTSEDRALAELEYHSNPGSYWTSDAGTLPPPTPLRRPRARTDGFAGWGRR